MTPTFRRKATLSLAIALAAATLLTAGVSFKRKLATFQTAGLILREAPAEQLLVATADPALHPQLRRGDRVLLIGGNTVSGLQQALETLRAQPSTEVVVMRGDEALTLGYVRPPLEIDYSYLIQAVIGGIYLFIGLYTILKEERRQSLVFYFWCLVSTSFYVLVSTPANQLLVDSTGRALYVLEEAVRLVLPALTLHFFITFPKELASRHRVARLVPFLYLPSAILIALQSDLIFNRGQWLFGSPRGREIATIIQQLDRVELFLFVVFAFAAGGLLLGRLHWGEEAEGKRQLAWIAIGMAGGYLPFLVLYLIPWSLGLHGPPALEILAVLPLAMVPLTFAYAILRYRLWDISVIARDVATYTLTLLFGLLGFTFLEILVQRGIPASEGLTRNILSLAAVLVMGGLLVPARQGISSTLERVQYRHSFAKRRTLAHLGRELLHDRDLASLSNKLLLRLEEALSLERANLLVSEEEHLVPLRQEQPDLGEILPDFLDTGFWQDEYRQLSGVALPDAIASPAQRLFMQGYRYAFPLSVRGRRVGALVCSHRFGDVPLSSDDLDLVRQFMNQASLAIENAHLLDRLQNQLREVRRLKQYNEGIIEASPAGIAVLDGMGRVVSANIAFAALCGAETGALRRKKLLEILPLTTVPRPSDGLVDLSIEDEQGKVRSLQISVAAFSGSPASDLSVLVANDITERVAMELALKEKDRLAALGVMAAGIAHEVNTPITGISSYAQMLIQDTDPDDPRYSLLRKVERQSFRASRIVNSLLSLARDQEIDLEPVDLHELIEESLELVQEQMQTNRVEAELRAPEAASVVAGSDDQLQQVFTNLFLNAIEAMKGEGGRLRVDIEEDDDFVNVIVRDSGPGIASAERERIFEPFFSTKQSSGGSGLGLSISHEIIRRHGGELQLENGEVAEGCRFRVKLRRVQSQA